MTRKKKKVKNPIRYQELIDKYVVKKLSSPIQWEILDEAKALQYHIYTAGFGDNTVLIVDCNYLPKEVPVNKAMDWIVEQGIAINKAV